MYFNKVVSQVRTSTNISQLTNGPVKGLPGYNPLLTASSYSYKWLLLDLMLLYQVCLLLFCIVFI